MKDYTPLAVGQIVRAKYPTAYNDLKDEDLGKAYIKKYLSDLVPNADPTPQTSPTQPSTNTTKTTNNPVSAFANKVGNAVNSTVSNISNVASNVGGEVSKWASLVAKYFPANAVQNALKIIEGESGGNPNLPSHYNKQGTEDSHGLFQINLQAHPQMRDKVLDPEENVKYAAQLYKEQGWMPWYNTAKKYGLL